MYSKNNVSDEEIIKACNNFNTMRKASISLNLHFNTFKNRAIKLKCYKPNRGGKGEKKLKKEGNGKFKTKDILNGKYPQYQTRKLKIRLIDEKILENKCLKCGILEWNNKKLILELDYINGISYDHKLENLRLLCPNCHSQTKTYRGKNIKKN